jgi:hypothetical protein
MVENNETEELLLKLKENLSNANDRSSQVNVLSEYILNEFSAFSPTTSKSTKKIITEYKKLLEKYPALIPDIPEATFTVFLSKNSNDQKSRINCPGKKQGYFLDDSVSVAEIEVEEAPIITELKKDIILEKHLYPFIEQWLFEKNHDRVADISSLKKNGKWGNPDLIGINIEEIYGHPEIEITTIEIKITYDGWEQWIFEAVAHTRFSNRSYFAFIHPDNLINKLDSTGLHLYAEHFNIGVLVLAVDKEDYLKIKNKDPVDLREENISVIEYRHAPFNETHIKFRKKFFESLNILEMNKLYNFGKTLG